jgi:hypothetical protein
VGSIVSIGGSSSSGRKGSSSPVDGKSSEVEGAREAGGSDSDVGSAITTAGSGSVVTSELAIETLYSYEKKHAVSYGASVSARERGGPTHLVLRPQTPSGWTQLA